MCTPYPLHTPAYNDRGSCLKMNLFVVFGMSYNNDLYAAKKLFPWIGMVVFSLTWRIRIYTFRCILTNFIKIIIFLLRLRDNKFLFFKLWIIQKISYICLKQKKRFLTTIDVCINTGPILQSVPRILTHILTSFSAWECVSRKTFCHKKRIDGN